MADLIGQTIKDYRIEALLGEGGMGAVYRAHQISVSREVAVKVLLERYANNPEFIRNFEFEARTIARLESRAIVPLYDYWREPGRAFLIIRYMRGGSLRGALTGRWDRERTLTLLEQIAEGLSVAHDRDIVHGDIKPENILLDERSAAYLADFGLASDLLRGIERVGYTPAYAAPEQIQQDRARRTAGDGSTPTRLSPQTDIYGLGVMLYEMLAGVRPFPESTKSDLEARHLNERLPDITQTVRDLPPALNEVLQKATEKRPADRYRSVSELAKAFRHVVTGTIPTPGDSGREVELTYLENPYKGLRPFEVGDAEFFFGREDLTQRLKDRLRETRFLAVVGASGSGKSSVVKAGLISALRRDSERRAQTGANGDGGTTQWFVREMTPGDQPFGALEEALLGVLNTPPTNLREKLHADPELLGTLARDLPDANAELVLVIDQFEEVFTLTKDEGERARFLNALHHAVTMPDSRMRLVITLRADFYDRPLQYRDFGELVRENQETVLPPNRQELERAIRGPVEKLGLTMEPLLINKLVNDVGSQPGMLPLLQYALTQLFEGRSMRSTVLLLNDYERIGGVEGALAGRAEALYSDLPDTAHQNAARELFLRLVNANDDFDFTRRRARRSELIARDERNPAMEAVIEQFGKDRLLTFDNDPVTREPTIEVAHEALLLSWRTLRRWMEESRDELRIRRQLENDAVIWVNNQLDTGFLAAEGRLAQFEQMATTSTVRLSPEAKAFLKASLERRLQLERDEREKQAERLRLAEEKAEQERLAKVTAEQLADQQRTAAESARRSAAQLRVLLAGLALFLLVAVGLAILAANQSSAAFASEQTAVARSTEVLERERTITAVQQNVDAAGVTLTMQAETLVQNQAVGTEIQVTAVAQAALLNNSLTEVADVEAISVQQAQTLERSQSEATQIQVTAAAQAALLDNSLTEVADVAATSVEQAQTLEKSQSEATQIQMTAAAQAALLNNSQTELTNVAATSVQQAQTLERSQSEATQIQVTAAAQAALLNDNQTNVANIQATADAQGQVAATIEGQITAAVQTATQQAQALAESGEQIATLDTGLQERANESFSQNLAARAELLLGAGDYQLAAVLALGANLIEDAPPGVQRVLSLAAYAGPRDIAYHEGGAMNAVTFCPRFFNTGRVRSYAWVTVSDDRYVRYWELDGQRLLRTTLSFNQGTPVTAVACSADGSLIAFGDTEGVVSIWNLDGGQIAQTLVETPDEVADVDDTLALLEATNIPTTESTLSDSVLSLAFSPETDAFSDDDSVEAAGKYLLVGYGQVAQEGDPIGRLWAWDIDSGEVVERFIGHTDAVSSALFLVTDDGLRIASSALNGEVILWDVKERDILKRIQYPAAIHSLTVNTAGDRLVSAAADGVITVWEAETLGELGTLNGHTGIVYSAIYDDSDLYILSTSADRDVILWDAETYKPLRRYRAHEQAVKDAAFGYDFSGATYVLSVSQDKNVMLWDLGSGAERGGYSAENVNEIESVDYATISGVGYEVLIGTTGSGLTLWDANSNYSRRYEGEGNAGHSADVQVVAFSPDGRIALSGDLQGDLVLWDIANIYSGQAIWKTDTTEKHASVVTGIAFSPDGRTAVSGSTDRTVRLWNVQTLDTIAALEGHASAVSAVAYGYWDTSQNADGAEGCTSPYRIASASDRGEIILWDAETYEMIGDPFSAGTAAVTGLAFSPDGKLLVSASEDRTLTTWNLDSCDLTSVTIDPVKTFRQHTAPVRSVAFNPDGTRLISASDDQTVIVWDVAEGVAISTFVGHTAEVRSARFSKNGEFAVSAGGDGRVIRWAIQDQQTLIAWTLAERFISPLDQNTTLGGQSGCDIRREYNLQPLCDDNGGLPTLTPFASQTPTPTLTPTVPVNLLTATATPTAQPTASATLNAQQAPTDVIAKLEDDGFNLRVSYEVERVNWSVIDLSFQRNTVRVQPLENLYSDFVMHATVNWGPGSLQDRCGFAFRRVDRENYYLVQIDQLGFAYFSQRADAEWQTEDGAVTGEIARVEVSTRDAVELVLVVEGEEAVLYVNGTAVEAAEPLEITQPEGYVALAATVFDRSRESSCVFKDVWVVDTTQSQAPEPTFTPVPLDPLDYPQDNPPPSVIVEQLAANRVPELQPGRGYLSEQINRLVVDMSDLPPNSLLPVLVETGFTYTDFIMGAQIAWGPGAAEDQCGFMFRAADGANFYTLSLDRLSKVYFDERENDIWAASRYLDGTRVNTAQDARNALVIVGRQIIREDTLPTSQFIVFINGYYAGEILDGTHQEGAVALVGSTFDESESTTNCTFNQVWVWNLAQDAPPTPMPTTTPVFSDTLNTNDIRTSTLAVGGREVWTYMVDAADGEGELVTIRALAARPANDADPQARIDRRLLDVELRVYRVTRTADGGEIETLVKTASDIIQGRETDAVLENIYLPSGEYRIEVFSWQGQTGGDYTLTLQGGQSATVTPTFTLAPTLTPTPTAG